MEYLKIIEKPKASSDENYKTPLNSSASPKRKKRYIQKYKKSWEAIPECRGWLMAEPNNSYMAFCKYCNTTLSMAGRRDLFKHADTKKHVENSNRVKLQSDLSNCENIESSLKATDECSSVSSSTKNNGIIAATISITDETASPNVNGKRKKPHYKNTLLKHLDNTKQQNNSKIVQLHTDKYGKNEDDFQENNDYSLVEENYDSLDEKVSGLENDDSDLEEINLNKQNLDSSLKLNSNSVSAAQTPNLLFVDVSPTDENFENPPCSLSINRKRYTQRYQRTWEMSPECRGWLMAAHNNKFLAFCRYCNHNIRIQSGKLDLIKHSKTARHRKRSKIVKLQPDATAYAKKISNFVQKINIGLEKKNDPNVEDDEKSTNKPSTLMETLTLDLDSNSVSDLQKNVSPKKKKRHVYKKSWEMIPEFRGWLTAVPNNNYLAFCKYCNTTLTLAGRRDLLKHSITKKHGEMVQLQTDLSICENIETSLVKNDEPSSVSSGTQNYGFLSVSIPLTGETFNYPLQNCPAPPNLEENYDSLDEKVSGLENNDSDLKLSNLNKQTFDSSLKLNANCTADENIENPPCSLSVFQKIQRKRNKQRYQRSWEVLPECTGWLMAAHNNKFLAFCSYCNRNIRIQSGKHDLIKHSKTGIHNKYSKIFERHPDIPEYAKRISNIVQKYNIGLENDDPNVEDDEKSTNKPSTLMETLTLDLDAGKDCSLNHANIKKLQEHSVAVQLQSNLSECIQNAEIVIDKNHVNLKMNDTNLEEYYDEIPDSVSDMEIRRSASPKKMRYGYQKYWQMIPELRGWLMANPNNKHLAYCKYCNVNLSMSGKMDLIKHSSSKKHKEYSELITKVPDLWKHINNETGLGEQNDINFEENVRNAEIQLSAFCVEHNLPFKAMDQLSQLIKKICPDSRIASKISCGSKKTTAIIKNVIGTTHFQLICEAMRNQCFSIYFDAESPPSSSSCDDYCSTTKLLSVIVRIRFNDKIRDMFLTMIKVNNTNAETLFAHIIKFFNDNNIDYKKNLIGIAADAATVITGGTNSVANLLEKVCPDLKIFKCVSHSFNLCSSYAAEKLPESLEILVRNIYNYLSNNPNNRLAGFDKIQSILEHKPIKMLHPYQSRWLSLEPLVRSISGRYNCLTIYFNNIVHFDKIGNNAKDIFDQLNNPLNELFLQFLNFILPKINKFNKLVQSDSPQIFKLYAEMRHIIQSILRCFIKPIYLNKCEIQKIKFNDPTMVLPLDGINCGDQVNVTMSLNEKLTSEQKRFFKIKCLDYYVELCTQIYKRFKFNDEFLRLCNLIDPEVVKSRQETDSISILSHYFQSFNTTNELFQKIHNEWTQLISFDFDSLFDDYSLSAISVEEFWYRIFDLKYEDNNDIAFPTLKELVLHVLTLPNSSANVERIFSAINLNNIKINHTFNTETLIGILHTKEYLLDDRIQSESSIFHDKFDSTRFMKSIKCNEDV